ncbi:alpha/beta hydrolase [uncultured Chitinophaga sp.]|uniref:alpha/beta hydrolase n=1 Tax=uncultured Chitinophaga sp. TaxID=339340 RepID=UPI0025DBA307|nr:alpha/beta hydrolase [uncultured Chitinophaga sp.]
MKKTVLFIQGGGDNGYEADAPLVKSLQDALGTSYTVIYPKLGSDNDAADFGWPEEIGKQIAAVSEEFIIVAHSLGASMLLKYLSENKVATKAKRIFLLAAPFWSGKEKWKEGLKLKTDFAARLPDDYQFYFYQCKDDEEVPFDQLAIYRQHLPSATFREFDKGGHQLGENVRLVGEDIKR